MAFSIVFIVPFVCSIAMERTAIKTVMLTAQAWYKMQPMKRRISIISFGGNFGEMSTGMGVCVFAPYCFGEGEYRQ